MKLTLNLKGNAFSMAVVNERDQVLFTDASSGIGGEDSAFRPMELVAAGLVSCSSIDLIHILRKKRKEVAVLSVDVHAHRVETIPAVFDTIHLVFNLSTNAEESVVEKALQLTFDKYCSVANMLKATVTITYSYNLLT